MTENTLWLPEGAEKNDIVFDLKNVPFLIGDRIMSGVNIREIKKISQSEAESFIKNGSNKIVSYE